MPDIVLATLNAKYIHASFGLRCLLANLGELRPRAVLAEFTINERPLDVAERILALEPRIVGLGVYVWNVAPMTELVALLKRLRPELVVILGGPEVSHEPELQPIVQLADCTIRGEGERLLPGICSTLLAGGAVPAKIVAALLPELGAMVLPYDEYTDADIAHRLIYVEASRGCPFACEFCLSSLDEAVRAFPLEAFLAAVDRLLARGVRHFKFVDRTFNLHLPTSRRILGFFLERMVAPACSGTASVPPGAEAAPLREDGGQPTDAPNTDSAGDGPPSTVHRYAGLFLHFELVPDRLPPELRELLARFPAGTLQLEVGIQSFDPAVTAAINRKQDLVKLEDNFRFLREHTNAHVHADLIVGLPGETAAGFGVGFDRLVALGPQEIQVGLLKRLRGAPIARHDGPEAMVYSPAPPYEILQNRVIDFPTMQRLRRFARYWELVGNSGNFKETLPLLWAGRPSAGARRVAESLHSPHAIPLLTSSGTASVPPGSEALPPRGSERPLAQLQGGANTRSCPTGAAATSPFAEFLFFSDWFFGLEGRHHGLALSRTMERVFGFLVEERGLAPGEVAAALVRDCRRTGYLELPAAVKPFAPKEALAELNAQRGAAAQNTRRQARHRGPESTGPREAPDSSR
ncbi:MAG: DUF4080 domain-containing protein [Opitutaceae bacterium]|nr:DUF4080 domain-containing protein [Opitutaceae bacterium]